MVTRPKTLLLGIATLVTLVHASHKDNNNNENNENNDEATTPLYKVKGAPIPDRVANLLSLMTLEEKVAQTIQPWTAADGNNYNDIIKTWGNTSLGAVYCFWAQNENDNRTQWEAQNDMQKYMVTNSRLNIPVTFVQETLHSGMRDGTVFPMPAGLGATWDVNLLQNIGTIIALEARKGGSDRGFSPEFQVDTRPTFGRTEEAFGEDPCLVAKLGTAEAIGMMGTTDGPDSYLPDDEHVCTEAKHYFSYGDGGKDAYRTDRSDRTLFNVYLRPWRAYAIAGGRGIMASHQETSGLPNHANTRFLTNVWRNMFGANNSFIASDASDVKGLVDMGVSVNCTDAAIKSITAGLDQDLTNVCFGDTLADSVNAGLLDEKYVDRAAGNILRAKFAAGLFDGVGLYVNTTELPMILDAPAHRALAYTAAAEGIILLVNQNSFLPLANSSSSSSSSSVLAGASATLGTKAPRIALIGPNAGCQLPGQQSCDAISAQLGGYSNTGAPIVTVAQALTETVGNSSGFLTMSYARGCNIDDYNLSMIPEAVSVAAASDVAIVVVGDSADGYGKGSCAEGIDADSLDLPGGQLALLNALVTQTTTPVVVVLIHGRPATFGAGPAAFTGANNELLSKFAAVVAAWRPGEEGGHAIVDLLMGVVNPSGRLAQNWVRHVGAISGPANPWFQVRGTPTAAYVTEPATPLFPFGHGLSYSQFTLQSISTPSPTIPIGANQTFTINATISSSASVGPATGGKVVVQVYVSQNAPTKYVSYMRSLFCFAKSDMIARGATVDVTVTCNTIDLEEYDPDVGMYVLFSGTYTVTVTIVDSRDNGHSASLLVAGNA